MSQLLSKFLQSFCIYHFLKHEQPFIRWRIFQLACHVKLAYITSKYNSVDARWYVMVSEKIFTVIMWGVAVPRFFIDYFWIDYAFCQTNLLETKISITLRSSGIRLDLSSLGLVNIRIFFILRIQLKKIYKRK